MDQPPVPDIQNTETRKIPALGLECGCKYSFSWMKTTENYLSEKTSGPTLDFQAEKPCLSASSSSRAWEFLFCHWRTPARFREAVSPWRAAGLTPDCQRAICHLNPPEPHFLVFPSVVSQKPYTRITWHVWKIRFLTLSQSCWIRTPRLCGIYFLNTFLKLEYHCVVERAQAM